MPSKKFYNSHRKQCIAEAAAWKKLHPENLKRHFKSAKCRAGNLLRNKRYRKSSAYRAQKARNIPAARARQALRRAKKKSAKVGDLRSIAKIYARAAELRALGWDVQVDHRVALANGGEHAPDNLRIISAFDNLRKGARVEYPSCYEFPMSGEPK